MERTGPDPNSKNVHVFFTDRLEIGVPEPRDVDELYRLIGEEDQQEVSATLVWDGPENPEEVSSWVELSHTESFVPFGFHWTIRDHTGGTTGTPGRPLGAIGTRPRGESGRADVGYWLGRDYWGQGLMAEALKALLAYGFTELNYYKMEADVFSRNVSGRRLVESAGMIQEGTIRKAYLKKGEFVDAVLYGLLYEDWVS